MNARRAGVIACGGWFQPHARGAGVLVCRVWFHQTPVVPRGAVPRWCGYAMGSPERRASPPNTAFQRRPLRVGKIGAFLTVRIGLNVIPIYRWRPR